jgi:hypothetical protein
MLAVVWSRHLDSWESLKGREYLRDLSIDEKVILKWMLQKYDVTWTGFIWLRIGTSDVPL